MTHSQSQRAHEAFSVARGRATAARPALLLHVLCAVWMLLPLTPGATAPLVFSAPCAASRAGCIKCWTGSTSASIEIDAPVELLFAAYSDIERMPRWSPMLESVELVDPDALRSEWALRVPRPLKRIAEVVGMKNLVQWEAVHEVEPPRLLRWRSLSGVQNSGFARFERGANDNVTTVTLTIEYTLPDVAAIVKLVNNGLAQRFVRKTMLGTMETFKEALEAEAAGTLTGAASGDAAQP